MAYVKVGSLWIRETKDGKKKYLSGVIELDKLPDATGKVNISVWKNDKGGVEKRPDYIIQAQVEEAPAPPPDLDDSEIPF